MTLTRVLVLAISLVSMLSLLAHAQEQSRVNKPVLDQQEKQAESRRMVLAQASVQPLVLPSGNNAWAIQVVSSRDKGGTRPFIGELRVTSEGMLVWSDGERSCGSNLSDEAMLALAKLVAGSGPWTHKGRSTVVDSMCTETTMILQRRQADGVARIYMVSWDDHSWKRLPADALALSETLNAQLMEQKACTR